MIKDIIYISIIFLLLLPLLNSSLSKDQNQSPLKESPKKIINRTKKDPTELPSPDNRIKLSSIKTSEKKLELMLKNIKLATFSNTNSMDPVLDNNSIGIQIIPQSQKEIQIGDIISFTLNDSQQTIIHRVINKSKDKNGTYFITKGDNLKKPDPVKIRFRNIRRILVGILY